MAHKEIYNRGGKMHWHIKAKNEDTYIQLHIKMHTQCSNNNYKQQWASHPSHPYVPLWKNTNPHPAPHVQETNRHQHK